MLKSPSRRGIFGPLLLACAIASGCVAVRSPRAGEPIDLAADEVLVFGRLRVADRGVELFPPQIDFDPLSQRGQVDFRPSLFQVETGKRALRPALEPDGTFWWILPRGTYLLFHTPPGTLLRNEVLAGFQIQAPTRAVYVGILDLDITSDPHSGPPAEYSIARLGIGDEFASAAAVLRRRHSSFDATPAKALLFDDPEFPSLFDDYSESRCARILARHGLRPLPGGD